MAAIVHEKAMARISADPKFQAFVAELRRRALEEFEGDGGRALEEFDDAREIVEGLAEEYAACESPDFIKWQSGKENERMPGEAGA